MKIEIHIVAHEKRREMAERLAEQVGATKIWWDNGFYGEWKNHVRAWNALAESDSTHAVVLQDDAVPIANFLEELEKTISRRPNDMISLYVGTSRPFKESVEATVTKANANEVGWIVSGALHWGVGVVIPTSRVAEVLHSARGVRFPYDQRMGQAWIRLGETRVSYCWPSLVDHEDVETVAHTQRQERRKAHRVGSQFPSDEEIWIFHPTVMGSVKDRVR